MPLAPVPPLPTLPELPRRAASPAWLTYFLTGIAVLSLALNAYVAWTLRNTKLGALDGRHTEFNAAVARPEGTPTGEEGASAGRLPHRAGLEQRLAALLAVSGDADRCRRLLDTLTPEECTQLGQALEARPPASDRNGALAATLGSLAANEPARAVALLEGVKETVLRTSLARQVVEVWIGTHPDAAANWLATDGMRFLDGNAASAPMLRAITQWSTFDPAGAAQFTAAQAASDRGPLARALGVASRAWGQLNMTAALAWANTLPVADPRRVVALQGIWEGGTERDPAGAGTALRELLYASGSGRPPVELAGTVARQWAQADPANAAQWAVSLPTVRARAAALTQVAATWVQADPAAAAQWAATLPASEVRGSLWKEIVNDWDDDPATTGTWLGNLPPGRDRDEAIGAYLPKVEPTEPEKALAWAATVTDPGLRAEQVQNVLAGWVRRDAVAARNWAAANGVPILPPRTAGP